MKHFALSLAAIGALALGSNQATAAHGAPLATTQVAVGVGLGTAGYDGLVQPVHIYRYGYGLYRPRRGFYGPPVIVRPPVVVPFPGHPPVVHPPIYRPYPYYGRGFQYYGPGFSLRFGF